MRNKTGFTLVELMVTIAVVAILVVVAMPSLNSLYQSNKADSQVKKIQQSMIFARNQAVSYGVTVKVCAYDGTECNSNNDWSGGFSVQTTKDGVITTLSIFDALTDSESLTYSSNTLSFSPDGLVTNSGTFKYCPVADDYCREIVIGLSGRVKLEDR